MPAPLRSDSFESRFVAGVFGMLAAIAMPVLGWFAWDDMAKLHDTGREGTLTVLAKVGEERERKSIVRYYDAMITDVRIQIGTTEVFEAGVQYPVLFLPELLHKDPPPQYSVDYIIGRKSETKWQIFIRDMGWPSLLIAVFFETFMLAGGLWLLSSARRMPATKPAPANILRDKPSATGKVI